MPEIEHVFVLMLENRSFDHLLGFARLSGIDAVSGGPTELAGVNGSETNALPDGTRVPVSAGAPYSLDVDPGHEFADVLEQLCGPGAKYPAAGGTYPPIDGSGFAAVMARHGDPATVMRCFRPDQVPVLTALAREFAVCDHWFSSLPGPTWPNRLFVHAASSAGLDASPTASVPKTLLLGGYRFEHGTLFDRVAASGRSWRIVEGDALPQSLSLGGMVEHALTGHFVTFPEFQRRIAAPDFADSYVFIEPHYGHVLADGRNFKCGSSQHPLDDITRGEQLVKDVYETIRRSPHWERSLLVITYDEHGGFYDHVTPPAAVPPGDTPAPGASQHNFRFDQLGVRVPAVIVSPLIPRGLIDHTVYDHASIPATVEHLYGLQPLTQRDAAAARFDHLLSLSTPRADAPMTLPAPADSGIRDCEDTVETALASDLELAPGHLLGSVDPALAGFVHVALVRQLQMAASEHGLEAAVGLEAERALNLYGELRTKFDAARYLRQIETMYQVFRTRQNA